MLTWLAIKAWASAVWKAVTEFCKERWELLVGVLVGVLGVLALTKGDDASEVLDEKNKHQQLDDEAQRLASEKEDKALQENLQSFFEKDDEAKAKYADKVKDLDQGAKDRVRELLDSENPEDEIAKALQDYLG